MDGNVLSFKLSAKHDEEPCSTFYYPFKNSVLYRIIKNTIDPRKFAIPDVSLTTSIQIYSLVFNTWSHDDRPRIERLQSPKVMDIGWTELSPDLVGKRDVGSSVHISLSENRNMGQRTQKTVTSTPILCLSVNWIDWDICRNSNMDRLRCWIAHLSLHACTSCLRIKQNGLTSPLLSSLVGMKLHAMHCITLVSTPQSGSRAFKLFLVIW